MLLYFRIGLTSLLTSILLSGCTTLESRLSIEPYTKNKIMRNELELAAEQFCKSKYQDSNSEKSLSQPDFIFTTDGCSRWPDNDWVSCCISHDISYWCGGSEDERKEADRELMRCVNDKKEFMGDIIYLGVRLGGHPWLPTPWRWGYGWDIWPGRYEKSSSNQPIKKYLFEFKIYELIEKHINSVNKCHDSC